VTHTAGWVVGGRYRITDRLGSGGAADVFRAHDELLGRDVAVKVFAAADPGSAPDAGEIERRAHELHALAQLGHPHLVRLFDASLDEQPAYLVMELVDGPNLAERLEGGPLPEAIARTIGAQLADALAYIHAHGMVHRDVKPANVLLGSDGVSGDGAPRARLSDFGIVRLLDAASITGGNVTLGTASYLAPEQAHGSRVGPPADVYSLGRVLLEALTGTAAAPVPAHLPVPWPALLTAMTAADPGARPTSDEIARTLQAEDTTGAATEVIAPLPVSRAGAAVEHELADENEPANEQGVPRRRRSGWLVALCALLATVIGVAGYFAVAGSLGGRVPPALTGPSTTPAGTHTAPRPSTAGSVAPAPAATVGRVTQSTPRSSAPTTHAAPTTSARPTPTPTSTTPAPSTPPPSSPTGQPASSGTATNLASSPPPVA